jgi:transcriptional regulator with XRE-family HTH domain
MSPVCLVANQLETGLFYSCSTNRQPKKQSFLKPCQVVLLDTILPYFTVDVNSICYNFFMENNNKLNNETFGKRLSRFRKERGLSQNALAEKIGISQSTFTDYERDILRLHDKLIVKLSKILKISSDELLGIKNNGYKEPLPNLRLMRRLIEIERLPLTQQKALLKNIDMFLKASKK